MPKHAKTRLGRQSSEAARVSKFRKTISVAAPNLDLAEHSVLDDDSHCADSASKASGDEIKTFAVPGSLPLPPPGNSMMDYDAKSGLPSADAPSTDELLHIQSLPDAPYAKGDPNLESSTDEESDVEEAAVEPNDLHLTPEPDLESTSYQHCGTVFHTLCSYCGAYRFEDERPGFCCENGKVSLDPIPELPAELQALYSNRNYVKNIRSYNNSLAMASIRCQEVALKGFTPMIKIQGKVHHFIGGWQPPAGQKPKFAQIYFHDIEHETTNRCGTRSLDLSIITRLQELLREKNKLVKELGIAIEIAKRATRDYDIVFLAKGGAPRNYDLPASNEIAALVTGDQAHHFDVVMKRQGKVEKINELNPLYDPLHYVLLLPEGTFGYSFGEKDLNGNPVTIRKYYCYMLQIRRNSFNHVLRSDRLGQQYFCDMEAKNEQFRIQWVVKNQRAIRADKYVCLLDAVAHDDQQNAGKSIIFPPTFYGSPRWYIDAFHDCMALVRRFGKPDFFITLTCNPRWPEIVESLYPGETPAQRPDIVVRVFHIKVQKLLKLLVDGALLGKVAAYSCMKEDQKRGLPHVHILLILEKGYKLKNGDHVAKFVSAEIPDASDADLLTVVKKHMIHGPCGTGINERSPCMKQGKCTKNFPKDFVNENTRFSQDTKAVLQRRSPNEGGNTFCLSMSNGINFMVDNRWVVPYNKDLLLMFNSHINVEVVNSTKSVKYIYSYTCKGSDKATFGLAPSERTSRNEVENYLDGRYIGAIGAVHKLFKFELLDKWPPVEKLSFHLPGEQSVKFEPEDARSLVAIGPPETQLTAFFKLCKEDANAASLCYPDVHSKYRWKNKTWISRKKRMAGTKGEGNMSPMVGRLAVIALNHRQKELYFMRILLHHVVGPKCFEDLRRVNGELLPTFHEACIRRGLIRGNDELDKVLGEAVTCRFGAILRELFAFLLLYCAPEDPLTLWERHKFNLCEDLLREEQTETINEAIISKALNCINQTLLDNNYDLCRDFGFPEFCRQQTCIPSYLTDEQNYDVSLLTKLLEENLPKLTREQRIIFDAVTKSVFEENGKCFAMDARAGSGKTFLLTLILAKLRKNSLVALATAVSGIAAIFLPNGRTLHSRCKVPLELTQTTTCNLTKRDGPGKLLIAAKILVIDEITMGHRYMFEALDRTLRFLRGNDQLFGGLTVLLSGDWRQVLPVVPRGGRADIVDATLKNSYIWEQAEKFSLTVNMRLRQTSDTSASDFAKFLINIGEGTIGTEATPGGAKRVKVPDDMLLTRNTLDELQEFVFGDRFDTADKCILAPFNDDVNMINDIILDKFPGELIIKLSADNLSDVTDEINYPPEFLNKLEASGMPSHILKLKVQSPVMLLRNLNPTKGHCNGTRYIVNNVLQNVVDLTATTGMFAGRSVLIPRIPFTTNDTTLPFTMIRHQFPLRPCFAMTIYKGQGQSLKKVGLYLKNQVFSHGQLYVAFSRVTSRTGIKVLADRDSDGTFVDNVVYDEVLTK